MMKVPLLCRSCALLAFAMLHLWPHLAIADQLLSGEDAAYIAWGVNTGAKGTNTEHAMVDKASDKGAAGLLRRYQGKDLSAARPVRRNQGLARSLREPFHRRPHQPGERACHNDLTRGYAAARAQGAVFDCKQAVQHG